MKKQLLVLLCIGFFFTCQSQAQKVDSTTAARQLLTIYHDTPVWIKMMNDPNVNYYEACKAFNAYWMGREIPAETEGEANELYVKGDKKEEGKSERERERERERKKKKGGNKEEEHEEEEGLHFKDPDSYTMIYSYKCFINWRETVKNSVDPSTGHILSQEQRDAIWKSQTQGLDTHIK
jgi:hypothetical protein